MTGPDLEEYLVLRENEHTNAVLCTAVSTWEGQKFKASWKGELQLASQRWDLCRREVCRGLESSMVAASAESGICCLK